MRIIAGYLGGRTFDSPKNSHTHPMSDKIRGALFNTLGDIGGFSVFDPFAGSGALGFEALSRGANMVYLIDKDRAAQATIEKNIKTLKLEGVAMLNRSSAESWLKQTDYGMLNFDLILLDPPFDAIDADLLKDLAECINQYAVLVLSLPSHYAFDLSTVRFELLKISSYGDAKLVFYRRR